MSDPITIEDLRRDVAAMLDVEPSEFADDDNLVDFGLDSMRLMQLAARWQARGVIVTFAELAERPGIGPWWELIVSQRAKQSSQ